MILNESEYHNKIDATLLAIEEALDELDIDIDYLNSGGVLTLTFENGSKIILNRQTPLQQLWIAAKSNGYHLDWSEESNTWVLNNTETFKSLMERLCSEQAGASVSLDI